MMGDGERHLREGRFSLSGAMNVGDRRTTSKTSRVRTQVKIFQPSLTELEHVIQPQGRKGGKPILLARTLCTPMREQAPKTNVTSMMSCLG